MRVPTWVETSRWGVEYSAPQPYVCAWPDETEARRRAAREPAVRLMWKNDDGEWQPVGGGEERQ